MTPLADVGAAPAATQAHPLYRCQLVNDANVTLPIVIKSSSACPKDEKEITNQQPATSNHFRTPLPFSLLIAVPNSETIFKKETIKLSCSV